MFICDGSLVEPSPHDFAENGVLNCDLAETGDVEGAGTVQFAGEAVGVDEVGVDEVGLLCKLVHFEHEKQVYLA